MSHSLDPGLLRTCPHTARLLPRLRCRAWKAVQCLRTCILAHSEVCEVTSSQRCSCWSLRTSLQPTFLLLLVSAQSQGDSCKRETPSPLNTVREGAFQVTAKGRTRLLLWVAYPACGTPFCDAVSPAVHPEVSALSLPCLLGVYPKSCQCTRGTWEVLL